LRKRYNITDEDCLAYVVELNRKRRLQLEELGHVTVDVRALEFTIAARDHGKALHAEWAGLVGWDAVFAFADEIDLAGGDVQRELDTFFWRMLPPRTGPPN
jgi:hypothetical protein